MHLSPFQSLSMILSFFRLVTHNFVDFYQGLCIGIEIECWRTQVRFCQRGWFRRLRDS